MRFFDVNLRPLLKEDYELVVAWWGIPEVRKFTAYTKQPTYEQIVESFSKASRRDFLINYKGRKIGRAVIIKHKDFEEVSIYICEINLQGKGLGEKILIEVLKLTKKGSIMACIHKDNFISKRLFMSLGFKYCSKHESSEKFEWYIKKVPKNG